MWTSIYALGSPKAFYHRSKRWRPILGLLSLVFLATGVFLGLFIAPPDYQQGDAFRIIYIHVPCAILSLLFYATLGFLSFLVLVWRIKLAELALKRVAEMGALMAFLALITGSIWGKPMWGAYWVWDARLTAELILLFLYCALLAIAHAVNHPAASARLMSILALVGLIDLPIIHYSVYWWNTLHQGATFSLFSKPKIAPEMFFPLILTLFGFGFYCTWAIVSRLQRDLLFRDQHKAWTQSLLVGV